MSNDIDTLRQHLFDTLAGLKNKSINIEQAKAMSDVAQVIINSAKVEVDYTKATGQKGSMFLDKVSDLPKGITGVSVHRIAG